MRTFLVLIFLLSSNLCFSKVGLYFSASALTPVKVPSLGTNISIGITKNKSSYYVSSGISEKVNSEKKFSLYRLISLGYSYSYKLNNKFSIPIGAEIGLNSINYLNNSIPTNDSINSHGFTYVSSLSIIPNIGIEYKLYKKIHLKFSFYNAIGKGSKLYYNRELNYGDKILSTSFLQFGFLVK